MNDPLEAETIDESTSPITQAATFRAREREQSKIGIERDRLRSALYEAIVKLQVVVAYVDDPSEFTEKFSLIKHLQDILITIELALGD